MYNFPDLTPLIPLAIIGAMTIFAGAGWLIYWIVKILWIGAETYFGF